MHHMLKLTTDEDTSSGTQLRRDHNQMQNLLPSPTFRASPCALRSHASLSEARAARNGQDEGPWEFKGQT